MKKIKNLRRLLTVLLMMPFFGCRTVTIKETKTVVPDYTFPDKPEFPMDIEKLPDGRYAINGEYFKLLETYFVLLDALEAEYNIDKELYTKGELNERRRDTNEQ